ncbi:MAG TPA: phosphatase PAP2 family protein [Nocardioidaceae bacterium]|nr:phosphatase PAP2 family protein [Nocardioidaceae bacterium]
MGATAAIPSGPSRRRAALAAGLDLIRPHRAAVRPWLVGEVLIVLLLVKVYDYVRSFAHLHEQQAFHNAQSLLSFEAVAHVDVERGLNAWYTAHHTVAVASSYWYEYTHVGVTLTALAACYLLMPAAYRAARNTLVLTNVIGMAIFLFYPVMPPRLLPGGGFVDTVVTAGFGSTHMGPVQEDQYGAMPSLHVAWAVWVAIVVFVMLRRYGWRMVVVLYPLIMSVVVIGTANHYVLDVIAGVLIALGAAVLTGLFVYGERPRAALAAAAPAPAATPVPPPRSDDTGEPSSSAPASPSPAAEPPVRR